MPPAPGVQQTVHQSSRSPRGHGGDAGPQASSWGEEARLNPSLRPPPEDKTSARRASGVGVAGPGWAVLVVVAGVTQIDPCAQKGAISPHACKPPNHSTGADSRPPRGTTAGPDSGPLLWPSPRPWALSSHLTPLTCPSPERGHRPPSGEGRGRRAKSEQPPEGTTLGGAGDPRWGQAAAAVACLTADPGSGER